MSTYVRTLKERTTDDTVYPVTKAGAVYMEDEESTVEDEISTLNSKTTANITLESNVTQTSSYSSLCEKTGKMITVYFAATSNASISSGTKIATVPSGYRPPRTFRHVVYATGGTGCIEFQANGAINVIGTINSGVSLIGIVTYQI